MGNSALLVTDMFPMYTKLGSRSADRVVYVSASDAGEEYRSLSGKKVGAAARSRRSPVTTAEQRQGRDWRNGGC